MSNSSYSWEAILSAKDEGLTSTIKGALGAIDNIDSAFNKLGGGGGKASSALSGVGDAAGKSESMLSKFKSAVSFGSVFSLAQQGMQTLTGGIGSLVSESANASDSINKFKSTMDFAGFTKKQTASATKDMKNYADQTVYELGDVLNTTAQLAANGVPGYQKLTKAAGNLNAVAGGNADTFKSVAMVMTQTAGAGKLTTENWNQLTDAIPGASGVLQAAMKKNGAYTGNFRDAMAKGEITANEFNKAISQTGMTKAAKDAAKSTATFEGAIGNLQAGAVNAFLAIYNAIGKSNITGAINAITNGISAATPLIQKGLKVVVDAIGMLVGYITGNFKSFDKFHDSLVNIVGADTAGKIMPVLAAIGGAIGDFVSVIKGMAGVLTGGISNYKQFSSALSETIPTPVVNVMYGIAKAIKAVVDAAIANPKAVAAIVAALVGIKVLTPVVGTITKIGSGFMNLGKTVGGIAGKLTGIGKAAETVATGSSSAGSSIAGMGTQVLQAGVGIGVAAAGFAALVLAITNLASTGTAGVVALAAVTVAIGALAAVFAVLGPALTANAVGIGVFGAAILAVGAGIGLASAGIAQLLTVIMQLSTNLTAIIPTMAAVGVGFGAMIAGFVTSLAANAPLIAAGLLAVITSMLAALTTAIPQFVSSGMQLLLGILKGINDNIGQIVTTALSIVVNFLNAVASKIGSVITAGVSLIVAVVKGISSNLGRIINAAVDLIGSFLIGLAKAIPRIADKALAAVTAFVNGVGYALGRIITSGGSLISAFVSGIMKGMGKSNGAAKSILNGISNIFHGFSLAGAGKAIMSGFLGGLKSMWGGITSFVGGIASWIKKHKGPISYDRRLLIPAGTAIMTGLNEGLQDKFSTVKNNVAAMAGEIADAASPDVSIGNISGSIADANRQLQRGITADVSGSLNYIPQPADINLSMGTRTYTAYVDDISTTQDKEIALSAKYRLK